MGTASDALVELTALRGLSPRQQLRLTMEALIEGTLYDEALDSEWVEDHKADGSYRTYLERRPLIQSGAAQERFLRLHDLLVGERMMPSVEVPDASDEEQERVRGILQDIDFADSLSRCAEGLLMGSGCMGFHRLQGSRDIGGEVRDRFEDATLDATWCEPVFVSQIDGPTARAHADFIAGFAPELVEAAEDDDGPYFRLLAPKAGGKSMDLAFLRYEWQVPQDVPRGGGRTTDRKIVWYRVDYLPDAIITYRPVVVTEDAERPQSFEPSAIDKTGWGLVPAVWVTPARTKPGAIDGPPLLTPQVRSNAQAMDYLESFVQDAANYSCSPQLVLRDLEDVDAQEAALMHAEVLRMQLPAKPQRVLRLQSITGDKLGEAKLLETDGRAIEMGHARLEHLDKRLDRLTGVINYDQSEAAGTLSGEAIKRMIQRMLDKIEGYRTKLEAGIRLLWRKMAVVDSGLPPEIEVQWPEIVEPTASDILALGQAFGGMVQAGVFPRDAAVREIGARLGRDDVDDLSAQVEAEEAERLQQAMDMAAQRMQGEGNGGPPDGDD